MFVQQGEDVLTLWDISLFPDLPMPPPGRVLIGFLYHDSLEVGSIICFHYCVVVVVVQGIQACLASGKINVSLFNKKNDRKIPTIHWKIAPCELEGHWHIRCEERPGVMHTTYLCQDPPGHHRYVTLTATPRRMWEEWTIPIIWDAPKNQ
jgi:hypothetical protein